MGGTGPHPEREGTHDAACNLAHYGAVKGCVLLQAVRILTTLLPKPLPKRSRRLCSRDPWRIRC